MARLNTLNSPQGFQQLVNFNKGKNLLGSQQPASNNNIVGNKGRLASREQQFGKGIGAFDRFYQSLTVDGEINNSDRDKLRSTLERFVRDGLIEGYQARNLYKRYGLSPTKVTAKYKKGKKTRR